MYIYICETEMLVGFFNIDFMTLCDTVFNYSTSV
jgi:hypothetical protein